MSGPADSGRGKPPPERSPEPPDNRDTDPGASLPLPRVATEPERPVTLPPESSLKRADPDLRDSWADDAQDAGGRGADLRESGEHTSIDAELAARLRAKYMSELGGSSSSTAPPPPTRDRSDPSVITAEVVEPSAEIAALPAPAPTPVARAADLDHLGPAFPEPDLSEPNIAAALADPAVRAEPPVPLAKPAEVPTAARPVGEAVPHASLELARDAAKVPAEDGWAGFQESGASWKSLTGESQVAMQPAPAASGPQYTRRNTDVYKLGEAARPKAEEGARLVGIGGADQGREFPVSEREVAVGRGPTNTIVLNDSSASREHARLLHEGDDYVLVDLRSANGTFVNGQRIDRAKLRSGDEVGFGNARFRFLEIGDVFKPVDASGAPVLPGARPGVWHRLRASPHAKSLVLSAGILLFTVIVTVVIVAVRSGTTGGRSRRDAIFQYYLQGVEAFKRRQWADAEAQFSIILGLDPTHARGVRYMQEVSRERQLEGQLAAARQSRHAGDLAQAYAQAAGITDSVYTPEATEILRAIDIELDSRVTRAKSALESGQSLDALKLLDTVEAVRPGRPDVAALRDRARMGIDGGAQGKSN